MKTYHIALVESNDELRIKHGESKVSDLIFWHLFNMKICNLILSHEDQDPTIRPKAEEHILNQKGALTILCMSFEIKGK